MQRQILELKSKEHSDWAEDAYTRMVPIRSRNAFAFLLILPRSPSFDYFSFSARRVREDWNDEWLSHSFIQSIVRTNEKEETFNSTGEQYTSLTAENLLGPWKQDPTDRLSPWKDLQWSESIAQVYAPKSAPFSLFHRLRYLLAIEVFASEFAFLESKDRDVKETDHLFA